MQNNPQNDLPTGTSTAIEPCLNCGELLQGRYCSNCGQPRDTAIRSFWHLIVDYFENTFNYDSRLFRTLPLLLFRPGKLTTEYLAGHRARYVPPLRMYLVISLVFFLSISGNDSDLIINTNDENTNIAAPINSGDQTSNEQEQADLTDLSSLDTLYDINPDLEKEGEESDKDFLEKLKNNINDKLEINFPFLSEEQNLKLKQRVVDKVAKISWQIKNDPNGLKRDFISTISKMMFALLPVFALLLRVIYIRSGHLYMTHLIQVIHTHCFIYLALLITPLPDYASKHYAPYFFFAEGFVTWLLSWLETLLALYIFYYIYKVIRVVYQQSRWKSLIKYSISSMAYFCLLIVLVPFMFILQLI